MKGRLGCISWSCAEFARNLAHFHIMRWLHSSSGGADVVQFFSCLVVGALLLQHSEVCLLGGAAGLQFLCHHSAYTLSPRLLLVGPRPRVHTIKRGHLRSHVVLLLDTRPVIGSRKRNYCAIIFYLYISCMASITEVCDRWQWWSVWSSGSTRKGRVSQDGRAVNNCFQIFKGLVGCQSSVDGVQVWEGSGNRGLPTFFSCSLSNPCPML